MWKLIGSLNCVLNVLDTTVPSPVAALVLCLLLIPAVPAAAQQQTANKPSRSGTSCTVVPGAQLVELAPGATLTQALRGRVAGLQTRSSSPWAGAATTISLRGISSMVGPFEPIVFQDGVRWAAGDTGSRFD
jgi:hypothetical protein